MLLNLIMAKIVHDSSGKVYNESESDQIFSSNICHLKYGPGKKNEGQGIHFGILSYLHFAGAAKSISCGNILKHPFNHLLQHTKIDVGLVLVSHKK